MNSRKITLNNEEYEIISDYKDSDRYRRSLNSLTRLTYGFDFEQWYRQGFWSGKYRPYSILHRGEIIANISVNPIDFLIDGCLHTTLQIGTVMTDQNFRHKGLSRLLMEQILDEYKDCCEMIYLYANDTVLEFYPKFGFKKADEYGYTGIFYERGDKLPVRKINMQEEKDRELIIRLVEDTVPAAKYSMVGNPGLVMFYLTSFMAEDIYYIEELDLAAVVTYKEDELLMIDAFCPNEFRLEEAINALITKPVMKVNLGFIPADTAAFTPELLKEEDTTFFFKGKNLIDKGRLPILSHA